MASDGGKPRRRRTSGEGRESFHTLRRPARPATRSARSPASPVARWRRSRRSSRRQRPSRRSSASCRPTWIAPVRVNGVYRRLSQHAAGREDPRRAAAAAQRALPRHRRRRSLALRGGRGGSIGSWRSSVFDDEPCRHLRAADSGSRGRRRHPVALDHQPSSPQGVARPRAQSLGL